MAVDACCSCYPNHGVLTLTDLAVHCITHTVTTIVKMQKLHQEFHQSLWLWLTCLRWQYPGSADCRWGPSLMTSLLEVRSFLFPPCRVAAWAKRMSTCNTTAVTVTWFRLIRPRKAHAAVITDTTKPHSSSPYHVIGLSDLVDLWVITRPRPKRPGAES